MGLFSRINKVKDSNVVIEGAYSDTFSQLNFEISYIKIPKDVEVLNDGENKYSLYANTHNFLDIELVGENRCDLELNVGSFSRSNFLVLGPVNIPLEPRAVCTRDGRIYLGEHMKDHLIYPGMMCNFVKMAGEFFGDERFSKVYKSSFK